MIKALEHLAIAATDPAALADWYCATLGFAMLVASPESQTYFVGLTGGGIIEILPVVGAATSQPATVGLHHLALAVDAFDAAYAQLLAQGVRFTGPAYRSPDGSTQFDFFTDPEGNRLQLVCRAQPLGKAV